VSADPREGGTGTPATGGPPVNGPAVRALVTAAMRLSGVEPDEETLARVLPLVQAALADGPRLRRAAAAPLEPLAHPGRPGRTGEGA
jgi:hypothetical protein